MPSHAASAATAYVQSASTVDSFITNNNTVVKSFTTQNVTGGNLVAVYVSWSDGGTLNSVTDNCGNTYRIVSSTLAAGTGALTGAFAEGAYAKNVKGGSKCQVTATFSNNEHVKTMVMQEVSGADINTPLDASVGTFVQGVGAGTNTIQSASFTTHADGDYIFGAMADPNTDASAITAGTNYTLRVSDNTSGLSLTSEDKTQVTASASIRVTFSTDAFTDALVVGMAFKPGAPGIQVSSQSDILSDSRPSATSNYTVIFTVESSAYGSSISGSSTLTLTLDEMFTIPVGMDCGDVDAATSVQFNFNYPGCVATATAWGFSATGSVITLVPPSGTGVYVPTSTQVTIKIGSNATVGQQGAHWIRNPSTAGIYTISVGGTFGGSGNILVSINSAVTVQVAVAESLAFTVSSVKAVNCTADDGATVSAVDTSPTSVPLGTLFPVNTFFTGCQDLVVSTNAGNGYSVTVQEQTLMHTLGGFTFPQTACDGAACTLTTAAAWSNPANNGFGHTCFNQDGNHDCASTYSSGTKFRPTANVAAGDAAQTVMASSTPASVTARIKYRISAGTQQAAGTYTTVIVYTITPTY